MSLSSAPLSQQQPIIAFGTAAEVFSDGPGRIVKLFRPHISQKSIKTEIIALKRSYKAGLPTPKLLGRIQRHGREGLILERLKGTSLLVAIRRPALRFPKLIREMARLQADIHSLGGADLPDYKTDIAERIEKAQLPLSTHKQLISHLNTLPDGNSLCHGDYHPGNLIVGGNGLSVLDWDKARNGVPAADVARSIIAFRFGNPTSPLPHSVDNAMRRFVVDVYRRAYIAETRHQVSEVEIADWIPVMAAAKLPYMPKTRHKIVIREIEIQMSQLQSK